MKPTALLALLLPLAMGACALIVDADATLDDRLLRAGVPRDSGAMLVLSPVAGAELRGLTTFHARLPDRDPDAYAMCWQIDGGRLNPMRSDGDSKVVAFDVSRLDWRGAGPYILTFVASARDGRLLARQSMRIFTQEGGRAGEPGLLDRYTESPCDMWVD